MRDTPVVKPSFRGAFAGSTYGPLFHVVDLVLVMIWTEEGHLVKRLTVLRLARGWTKATLARRAALAEADIGKFESGRLQPYDTQLKKLARALDVPVSAAASLLDTQIDDLVKPAKRATTGRQKARRK